MPGPEDRDEDWKTTVNLLAVVAVLALLLAGLWVVMELDKAKKAQDCLSSTLRRCRQIDAP